MAQTYDLTKGKTTSLVLKFFFPILLTNMLQQLYNIADTIIVGKGLGDDKLAAVGNMSSLTFFIIGFSIGLTNGFSIVAARYFGAKDNDHLRSTVAHSLKTAAAAAIILMAVSIIFLRPVLGMLHTSEKIMDDSLLYGYIIFGGLIATIAYNLCAGILRALGDSKTPFIAIAVSTVINVVFNWVTVYLLGMGVEGPAIVTIAAQVISVIICLAKLRKIEIIRLSRRDMANDRSMYGELLKNGIPMAVMNSITAVGCMTVQYFVNSMGVEYTSAYSACSKYLNLFMQPACTAGITMSAFTSQNHGAGRYDRIMEGLKVCSAIALIAYVSLGAVMVLFPRTLASFMLNGDKQISLAAGYLVRCGVLIVGVDMLFVIRSGCQGLGKPMVSMISGILEMVMRVFVIAVFTKTVGFNATIYAEGAAWFSALALNTAAFIIFMRRFLGKSGKVSNKLEVNHG